MKKLLEPGKPVLLLMMLMVIGCSPHDELPVEVQTEESSSLKLGIAIDSDPAGMVLEYTPLVKYMSARLGRPVELVIPDTYRSVGWLLEKHRLDLAWISGTAWRTAVHTSGGETLTIAVRHGATTYKGIIVVKKNSPVQKLTDLRGRRLAYVDPHSGSGYVAANELLLNAGLSPGADLKETYFTYSHLESLKDVLDDRADAAAVFDDALLDFAHRVKVDDLRILATSDIFPNDIVVSRSGLDPALKEKVRNLLLNLAKDPEGKRVLTHLRRLGQLDGFLPQNGG